MLMNKDEFNMWTVGSCVYNKEQIVTYTNDYFLIAKNQSGVCKKSTSYEKLTGICQSTSKVHKNSTRLKK